MKDSPKMIKHEIAEAKAMKPKKMACGGEVKRGYGAARKG